MENDSEEISLIDLLAVLLRYKKMIIIVTVVAMVAILVFSIISLVLPTEKSPLPNKYTAKAEMLINNESSEGGLSSLMSSSGMSGLASLAGIDVGTGAASNSALAIYLVHSNSVMDNIISKFDLVKRYKIKKFEKSDTRKALQETLISAFDEDSGVFTVSFTDVDPVFAQSVVNHTVGLLEARFDEMGIDKNKLTKVNLEKNIENTYNEILSLQKQIHELEFSTSSMGFRSDGQSIILDATLKKAELAVQQEIYAQLKSQYELLKVTMASEQPVFQILEYAEVPDKKSGPSRGMLCIIVTFAAFFVSVFMAFLLNAIKNVKADPEAMKKLRFKGK